MAASCSLGAVTEYPSLPQQVGPYRLIALLGSRGFFHQYLASVELPGGGQQRATVKVIGDEEDAQSAAVRLRWLSGIRSVALVQSPHVVALREIFDCPAGLHLIAEYTEAGDAASFQRDFLLQNQRIPEAVAGRILLDALAGLEAIHEACASEESPRHVHGHLHRNQLLVGVDGRTQIDDFSTAWLDDWYFSGCQGPMAIPLFKGEAPEQLCGQPVDAQTDLWSAGAMAWELLGKRLDFALPHGALFDRLFAQAPMPDLRSVRPDLPSGLAAVIARALEPQREDRWPSVQAFREALTAAWQEIGPVAERAEVGQLVREWLAHPGQ